MCVGYWSLDDPEYALVLCTNRDEFLSRPTAPAHWHSFESLKSHAVNGSDIEAKTHTPDGAFVLSGRDTLAGGTWCGINKQGEVALLTNITESTPNLPSSRGHLCSSFLCRNQSSVNTEMSSFVTELVRSDMHYSGFNLLLLAPSHVHCTDHSAQDASLGRVHYDIAFLSNGGAGKPIGSYPVPQQSCNGISNGVPNGAGDSFAGVQNGAEWPKVVQGSKMLSGILAAREPEDILVDRLFSLLSNKTHSPPATREAFQELIMIDPVDLGSLRIGPSLVQTPQLADNIVSHESDLLPPRPKYFGTRLSTVLLVRRTGDVLFIERDIWLSGTDGKGKLVEHISGNDCYERRFRFQVECRGGCKHLISINPASSAFYLNCLTHILHATGATLPVTECQAKVRTGSHGNDRQPQGA